jgi:hypothetical protein
MPTTRTITIKARQSMQAGEFMSPTAEITDLMSFRIQLTVTDAQWNDPDFFCSLEIHVSESNDFTTYDNYHAEIVGGSRTKNGELPFIQAYWQDLEGQPYARHVFIRGRLNTNATKSIGLNGEYVTVS